jgi:hypothetical protein
VLVPLTSSSQSRASVLGKPISELLAQTKTRQRGPLEARIQDRQIDQ